MPKTNELYAAIQNFRRALMNVKEKPDKAIVSVTFFAGHKWRVTIEKYAHKKKTTTTLRNRLSNSA